MVTIHVTEQQIREVMMIYFRLFPTNDPYGAEGAINRVVDEIQRIDGNTT
jgi:hypothetical protein